MGESSAKQCGFIESVATAAGANDIQGDQEEDNVQLSDSGPFAVLWQRTGIDDSIRRSLYRKKPSQVSTSKLSLGLTIFWHVGIFFF